MMLLVFSFLLAEDSEIRSVLSKLSRIPEENIAYTKVCVCTCHCYMACYGGSLHYNFILF